MKQKKAAKKSKGKGKGGGEWGFEGGLGEASAQTEEPDVPVRRYRHTQEKDESIRRSRFKQALARQQSQFVRKMRAKVTFGQTLPVAPVEMPAERRQPRPARVRVEGKSVLERLQQLLAGCSAEGARAGEEDGDSIAEDSEEEEEGFVAGADEGDGGRTLQRVLELGADDTEDLAVGDPEAYESDGDDSGDPFKAFFSAELPDPSTLRERPKKLLGRVGELAVHGHLNASFPLLPPVQRLGDVPRLPKLWRARRGEALDPLAAALLPYCLGYGDVLFESRTAGNDAALLDALLLHALVHVVKARTAVARHNHKLKARADPAARRAGSGKKQRASAEEDAGPWARDQGFTRARVLVLCPFRSGAAACVSALRRLLGENTTVSNTDRFAEEFGPPDDEGEGEEDRRKPADWRAVFEGSNVDDDFKMGVQVNPGHGRGSGADKGAYLRLFTDFYNSDFVIASPLGIKLLLESKGKGEADFLSSVEVAIVHQADVIYYQNWEHVDFVLRAMNQLPASDRGTDFARVRPYFLEGNGKYYRQLLISSSFNHPTIQASFREFGTSLSHRVMWKADVGEGSIADVLPRLSQVFHMVPVRSIQEEDEDRFQYFKTNVIGPITRLKQNRTLIVAPSYLHFIQLRNYFMETQVNAAYISEYSRDSEISRARSRFFHGDHDILLYSGRAHFFRRFHLRGAMHLVLYALPETPGFYPEFVNMLSEGSSAGLGSDMSCIVLFSKFERMMLDRIVGTQRSSHMFNSEKSTFVFK